LIQAHLVPGEPQLLVVPSPASGSRDIERSPQKQRRVVQGPQDGRIKIKLAALFPEGVPSDKELSDAELVQMVVNEFKKGPQIAGLGIPDRKTILRVAGRIPRKK
jgi:hypothetical protein